MNRAAFLKRVRELADVMEQDHEEHTGIGADEEFTFYDWLDDLTSLHENTR